VESLVLIGVSYKRGGVAALELWQAAFPAAASLAQAGFSKQLLLVTCNRWDAFLELPAGMTAAAARRLLTPRGAGSQPYAYQGEAALEQLARVASSLDSLNPGEDQIMKQVRDAWQLARQEGYAGGSLSHACQTVLRIAKRVRREVPLAPLNTSLFSLARPELERQLPARATVAIIGAGEMASLAARSLAGTAGVELLIVNRSPERAARLAEETGGRAVELQEFLAAPPPLHALVSATPVAGLLSGEFLGRCKELRIVIDLGIPRNVEQGRAGQRITVLDVESLRAAGDGRREGIARQLAAAEVIVQEEITAAVEEWTQRQLGPAISRLRELYLDTIGETLPPEEARKLAHRFAHVPVKGLRALARTHGHEAVNTFLKEADLL
jgi:glutamyl-tRNA reductase